MYDQLSVLQPEDHSSQIKNKAFYTSTQLNENVKLEELGVVDVDKHLKETHTVN